MSPGLNNNLARSRSRYKGSRPNQSSLHQQRMAQVSKTQDPQEPLHVSQGMQQAEHGKQLSDDIPLGQKYMRKEEQGIKEKLPSRSGARETSARSRTDNGALRRRTERTDEASSSRPKPAREDVPIHRQQTTARSKITEDMGPEAQAPQVDYGILPPEYSRFRMDGIQDRRPHRQGSKPEAARPKKETSHSEPPKGSTLHKARPSKSKEELKRAISAPMAIEPTEVPTKPAFDAPVSAVNAGERRVTIIYNEVKMSLAVTPSTTPLEIIRAAGDRLSQFIDPKTNLVLESFKQLSLERPLRRYEHIRDVMNSWDNDQQNCLTIVPSSTGGRDEELDLKSVTHAQPGETSVFIYHSQRPGTWDKRWVTLRSDGQVSISKKDRRESFNICHLSDFDIYIPVGKQAKKIRAPKKICFAVKSQQKSSMFLTTENFVHFFSTSDKELARSWYRAVQEWRSWYLVNVLGQGQTKAPHASQKSIDHSSPAKTYPAQASLDRGQLQQGDPAPQQSSLQRLPTRSRGPPPVSFPQKLSKNPYTAREAKPSIVQTRSHDITEAETFAQNGLLGRSYTQRRKAQQGRERNEALGMPIDRQPQHDGASASPSGLQRNSSQRAKPQKPFIDLSSVVTQPILQHRPTVRAGGQNSGGASDAIPPGGLVSAATNAVPDADANFTPTKGIFQRSGTVKRGKQSATTSPTSGNDDALAFTGGGLLAGVSPTAGQSPQTRDSLYSAGPGGGRGFRIGNRGAKQQ